MQQYALLFRMDISPEAQPTAQQMEQYMQQWMEWIGTISAAGQMESGNHFATTGKVLYPQHKTTQSPYTKDRESVAGYIIISAKDEDGALEIARRCPILNGEGTSVEVRQLATPGV